MNVLIPISIEPAEATDLPEILALLARNQLPEAGLVEHLGTILVARTLDSVVGSAALELYGEAALLRSVAVEEGYRGKGLGKKLTEDILHLARYKEIESVYLLTETAEPFFSKLGFRPISREIIPVAVQQSLEFTSACPATAQALVIYL